MTKKSTVWGLSREPLLFHYLQAQPKPGQKVARITVQASKKAVPPVRVVEGENGVDIFLSPLSTREVETDPRLKTSPAARLRDGVGSSLAIVEKLEVGWVEYNFELDAAALNHALLGLELALYRFKRVYGAEPAKYGISLKLKGKVLPSKLISEAAHLGCAVNLARHLTNLPPNVLHPISYAEAARDLLAGEKNVKVEIWNEERLKKERMFLHLAVGQGSQYAPRLVHIQYRPPGAKKAPIAFVGKGITFDSGGLDIKPSSGMRLMKKDMGGSAAVLAVASLATQLRLKVPMDFYMALAENSIGGRSFRPSDVIVSRNGQTVEIHNTDAEGRLVLADALDVAATQTAKPRCIVDVATLTGAIKVALGSGIAGLFTNNSKLEQGLTKAGQQSGDLVWSMPLFQRYRSQLNSIFADQVNSSDGFGSAITAALFLQKFVGEIPWAHLDIYAWKDAADGAWLEGGGSGQAVLNLAQWLKDLR